MLVSRRTGVKQDYTKARTLSALPPKIVLTRGAEFGRYEPGGPGPEATAPKRAPVSVDTLFCPTATPAARARICWVPPPCDWEHCRQRDGAGAKTLATVRRHRHVGVTRAVRSHAARRRGVRRPLSHDPSRLPRRLVDRRSTPNIPSRWRTAGPVSSKAMARTAHRHRGEMLRKPFTLHDLARQLRQVLNRA